MAKAKLVQADYQKAADALGAAVAAVIAVTKVESRGDGFLDNGVPVLLFERHVMYQKVFDKFGPHQARELAEQYPDLCNKTPGGYGKYSEQPDRMARAAAKIDRDCALESASWGLFQIMGYHWQRLGYKSLQEFVNAMYYSEADQLDAFVRFVKANPAAWNALKALDWAGFALAYNGPSYRKNQYDKKMAAAFTAAGGVA